MPKRIEKRILPYTPEQCYDLVLDIEKYPEFLPWCTALEITERTEHLITAKLTVGYQMFKETFTCKVIHDPVNKTIHVEYIDGPMKYLRNEWAFRDNGRGGTKVHFLIDFELKARSLNFIVVGFFNKALMRMISAFEKRAHQVYSHSN